MTVKPSVSYALMAPMAELMIVPKEFDYDSWLAANNLPAAGDDDGSYDAEMPLLMRYGFAIDPRQPFARETTRRIPRAVLDDGYLTLHFRRKPAAGDLLYQVEYTNDFNQWFGGPEFVEEITWQVAPNDPGAAVFRAKRPISEAAAAGMRVRLERSGTSSNP